MSVCCPLPVLVSKGSDGANEIKKSAVQMKGCSQCHRSIQNDENKECHGERVCNDCYINQIFLSISKAYVDNDSELIRMLKELYFL